MKCDLNHEEHPKLVANGEILTKKMVLNGVLRWGMGGFVVGEGDLKIKARVLWVRAIENWVSVEKKAFIHVIS